MPSQFSTITSALRGLQAQQKALETSAHNIANANTQGFSRQKVILSPTVPYPWPGINRETGAGQIGTGVDVTSITRNRDEFLDGQMRLELGTQGQWEIKRDTLEQVEVVFMEPSETGLNVLLGQFWDSWQEMSKNPESSPVRTTVRETALALTEAIRHTSDQLESIQNTLSQNVGNQVLDVNSIADQIVNLNRQISFIVANNLQPNDMMDQRDLLLDELSAIMDFSVEAVISNGKDTGMIRVITSGLDDSAAPAATIQINLVDGLTARHLQAVDSGGTLEVRWEAVNPGDPEPLINPSDGKLPGTETTRDVLIQSYLDDLDRLARGLIARVNEVHQQGIDLNNQAGGDFFSGSGAADLDVAVAIKSDVRKMAASISGSVGEGTNALAIVQLRSMRLEAGTEDFNGQALPSLVAAATAGGTTFDTFYKDLIARLGVDAHEAGRMATNQKALVDQLNNRREQVSGVSLDEEVAYVMQYQRVYQSAARIISTLDDMLDTLINKM